RRIPQKGYRPRPRLLVQWDLPTTGDRLVSGPHPADGPPNVSDANPLLRAVRRRGARDRPVEAAPEPRRRPRTAGRAARADSGRRRADSLAAPGRDGEEAAPGADEP